MRKAMLIVGCLVLMSGVFVGCEVLDQYAGSPELLAQRGEDVQAVSRYAPGLIGDLGGLIGVAIVGASGVWAAVNEWRKGVYKSKAHQAGVLGMTLVEALENTVQPLVTAEQWKAIRQRLISSQQAAGVKAEAEETLKKVKALNGA